MQIYVTRNGQQFGPYDEVAIRAGLQSGSFSPADLVWHEGAAGWAPLSTLPGMAAEIAATAPPPPPPPPPIPAGGVAMPRMVPLAPGAAGPAPKQSPKWLRYLSVAVTVASVLIGLLIFLGRKEMMGSKYQASSKEAVNYSGKATEADARNLAKVLKDEGYFSGEKNLDVLLKKEENGRTIVSFVLVSGWNDDSLADQFRQFGQMLSQRGVGKPLTIRLVDTNLNQKREIPVN